MAQFKDFESPLFNAGDFQKLYEVNPINFSNLHLEIPIMTPATRDNIGMDVVIDNEVFLAWDNMEDALQGKTSYAVTFKHHTLGYFQQYIKNWNIEAYNIANTILLRHNCKIVMAKSLIARGSDTLRLKFTLPEDLKNTLIDLECPYWEELSNFKKDKGHPSMLTVDMPKGSLELSWDTIGYGVCYTSKAEALAAISPYLHPDNKSLFDSLDAHRYYHVKYIFTDGQLTGATFYTTIFKKVTHIIVDYKPVL